MATPPSSTFRDNRTKSVIFQVVFRQWDGDSHFQLLDGVSAPTLISVGFTASLFATGKRRSLANLSLISLKEEAAARASKLILRPNDITDM